MAPELPLIRVPTRTPCDLLVGPGAARLLPPWLAATKPAARYAVIADQTVASLHAGALAVWMAASGLSTGTISFPAGEAQKTRATKETIEDAMLAAGFGRDTVVIALGGGVTGDLAGFVAATYLRGVPWIALPTTLLAMVDSSIGGKTGVDHPRGKNLIGAFHQPVAVFADTDYLGTLPERERISGFAEVVKAAYVKDADLFASIEGGVTDLPATIRRACTIKAMVVGADELEKDLRRILNFGHTIGHALEVATGWTLLHGEAVAIGMVAEARIAVRAGLLDGSEAPRLEAVLSGLGLPVAIPSESLPGTEAILSAARMDKKTWAGQLHYALPVAPGRMARGPRGYGIPIDDALAAEVLEGMREPPERR